MCNLQLSSIIIFLLLLINNRIQPSQCLLPPVPNKLDKGFNILETTSKLIPQGRLVKTAKETWKFAWQRLMAELAPQDPSGRYSRPTYTFKGTIGGNGSNDNFPDEGGGRYHVYLGNPCPWCHRVRLVMALKKLNSEQLGMTILIDDPTKASRGGWIFGNELDVNRDPLGSFDLRELYDKLSPGYRGRCTAPLLVDLKTKRIVSNESSDIVRMLNKVTLGRKDTPTTPILDLVPDNLLNDIETTNQWVYELLNNGVYRCGFSTQQQAYDSASQDVKRGLDKVEAVLTKQKYLCGDVFTEADLRLLPTILRFDGAYSPLFRAGGVNTRIRDYPHLLAWLQRCWDIDGVKDTIDLQDAVSSYYKQLFPLNPGGLIPSRITPEDIGLH